MSRIRVTIDGLALGGMEPAERTALVEGLKTELERVLAEQGAWKPRRTPVVRLQVPWQAGVGGGRAVGQIVARGVARAIGRSVKP